MPDLYQIQLPSGTTYDLRDSRVDTWDPNKWDYIICTSASNTPYGIEWDSGGTTITGTLVASDSTMYKIYLVPRTNGTNNYYDEYITIRSGSDPNYTYAWELVGSTGLPDMDDYVKNASGHSGDTAGALAYKDSVSGTPSGSIGVGSGTANYTPAGSISVSSAGSTGTASSISLSNPDSTQATGELVYMSVSGTTLSFKKFVDTPITAKTGDASYSFSGTGTELTFTGESMTSS